MMNNYNLTEEEAKQLKPIIDSFMAAYVKNHDKNVSEWLPDELQRQMPEKSHVEIVQISDEIIESIKITEEKKESLNQNIKNGVEKSAWFVKEMKTVTSSMTNQEAAKFLAGIDGAISEANESLINTFTTKNGLVSQNPNLDGFIAEKMHADSFNINAEACGSKYRAEVLEPKGTTYSKNSVDIVIKDENGKIVRKYQSKYCKDAKQTQKAFENGDYKGQRRLVPEGQDVANSVDIIKSPDGKVSSTPLSKEQVQELQRKAQSGCWDDVFDWNSVKSKDLVKGIGKQSGQAAVMGAAIGAGMEIASSLYHGEEIDGEKIVESALTSGADFGIKTAAGAALKVGVEKDIIKCIPKGTPAATIANIAFVAIEDIKIVGKMATGEFTMKQGLDKIEQTTAATIAGLSLMGVGAAKGAAIGASIGSAIPVIGTAIGGACGAVGGFIGGCVAYTAGSTITNKLVQGYQKVRDEVTKIITKKINKIVDKFQTIKSLLA